MRLNFTSITLNYIFLILSGSLFFIFTVYFLGIPIPIIITALFGFITILFLYFISKAKNFLSFKSVFFLVAPLILFPFVIFSGNNSVQQEFFNINFFGFTFVYFLFVFSSLAFVFFVSSRNWAYIIFLSYFLFFQFYFIDFKYFAVNNFIIQHVNYITLIFIAFISLLLTYLSNWVFFRKFVILIFFLNILFSAVSLFFVFTKNNLKLFSSSTLISHTYENEIYNLKKKSKYILYYTRWTCFSACLEKLC